MTQSQSRSRGRGQRRVPKAVTRVVTYRRISTNEVNQPYSLEAQERNLGEYIARTPGLVRVGDYFDMQTGTKTERPGLQALLRAAAAGEFDLVLIYRIDRLARSVHGFMEVLNRLAEHGVSLHSATETFETMSPSGKLMAQTLASFAEFEHDVLMDRILEGFTAKAMKGEWLGGPAPYGYANDRENRTLRVVADEAPTVRRIYQRYLDGLGAKTIAEELNTAGLRARGGRPWTGKSVLRLLASPTYAGLIERNDEYYPGRHEAIVSRDDFEQAMALRQSKVGDDQFAKMRAGNSEFFLSGIARCGACGGAFVGAAANSKNRHYRYYDCSMKSKRSDAERCRNDRVDADALEEMVVERLLSAYRDSDLFLAAVRLAAQQAPERRAALEEQVRAAEAAVAHMTRAIDRYYAAFEAGELDPGALRPRVLALGEQLDAQRQELARLERERDESGGAAELVDLEAATARIEAALSQPESWRAKRRLVGALVESVVVSPGRHVRVTLRVPTVGDAGPADALSDGRVRRARSGTRGTIGHGGVAGSGAGSAEGQWTPFRMGSHMVQPWGFEPQLRPSEGRVLSVERRLLGRPAYPRRRSSSLGVLPTSRPRSRLVRLDTAVSDYNPGSQYWQRNRRENRCVY